MVDLARYAELFRTEAREHLDQLEMALEQFRQDHDTQHVAVLFRAAHTIKGMAAAMGYDSVERLAHALETFLDGIRQGTRTVDDQLVRTLQEAADALAHAVDDAARVANDTADTQARTAFGTTRSENGNGSARRVSTVSTVRVEVSRLDALLDLAGELVLARDHLLQLLQTAEGPSSRTSVELHRAIDQTSGLITALQDEVMRVRLVPVQYAFDRFPRFARELARELGKDVELQLEGRDIEVDRSLLDAIGDCVIHLLRNAIDHGIEPVDLRRAVGKDAAGHIVLRAMRDRTAIVIQIEDDGRGIDRDVILQRALERSIVSAETETLDDEQLLQAIATPGLTTAHHVTQVSGRGVGLDAVVARVRTLGGTVQLETATGQGTRFTMRLPATLAITRALLVSAGGEQFAFSAAHVVDVHAWDRTNDPVPETVTIRDSTLPLVPLVKRFGLMPTEAEERHLVVVDAGAGRRAILVDEITGHQDIVVKRFQSVHEAHPWFSGATVLGDGRPALIVDVSSLS